MLRRLKSLIFGRLIGSLHWERKVINLNSHIHKSLAAKSVKLLTGTQLYSCLIMNGSSEKPDIEEGLHRAMQEGNAALLKVMDQIKEFVIITCEEYRRCLAKQIEIMDKATQTGPFSETWDDLPQYRTLASELLKELNEYVTLFNTVSQMALDGTLREFVREGSGNIDLTNVKFKELETILQKELEENKKLEKRLLEVSYESILQQDSSENL